MLSEEKVATCFVRHFLTFERIKWKAWESGHNKTQTADCTPCRPRFVRWRISTFSALGTLAN